MREVPKQLRNNPFTYQQAIKAGLTARKLASLVNAGSIEQVVRGIYRLANQDFSEEQQFRVASLLVGDPSAICLLSALAHYGLTDVIPKKTWIMVPQSKRSQHRELKLLRSRSPDWHVEIETQDGYRITSLERTLVELICNKKKLGSSIALTALRKAVTSKRTSLSKIIAVAKHLKLLHRILPYIEALS